MITKPFNQIRPELPIAQGTPAGIKVQKDWYTWFFNVYNAITQGLPLPESDITVTASPFSYTAIARSQVIVSGGTVSAIELSRNGTDFYSTGQTAGTFQLDGGDLLRVTYSGLPTLTLFPM